MSTLDDLVTMATRIESQPPDKIGAQRRSYVLGSAALLEKFPLTRSSVIDMGGDSVYGDEDTSLPSVRETKNLFNQYDFLLSYEKPSPSRIISLSRDYSPRRCVAPATSELSH